MKRQRICFISFPVFSLLFSVVSVVMAGVDKFPQRTEDARTLVPDAQELRFGLAQWEEDRGPELQEVMFSYSRGFAGGLELGLMLPYTDSDPSQGRRNQGFGDLRLYGELAVTDFIFSDLEKPVDGISFALTLFVDGLESDKDLHRHNKQSEFTLNVMKDLGPCISHFSIGAAGYDDDFERAGERIRSVPLVRAGLERSVEATGTLYLDWLWQENEDANTSADPNQVGLGWKKHLAADLSVDAGFWMGLSRAAPDTQFALGVTRRF